MEKRSSLDALARCVLFAILPALSFYALALAGLGLKGFIPMEVLRDAAQQTGQSSFLGFLSNIGVWLWVSSAAIAFCSAATNRASAPRKKTELALLIGVFSLALAVDDFFLIHDRYINEYLCYAGYAVFAAVLLFRHARTIFSPDGVAFLLAGSLLALSILSDVFQSHIPVPYAYVQVFEEGFKFAGGAVWLRFCGMMAQRDPAQVS